MLRGENIGMPRIIEGTDINLVGDNVRIFRKKKKLTQKQLSEKLETLAVYVCRGSIARIEGKTRTVTDVELWGLSVVLDANINDFFPNTHNKK